MECKKCGWIGEAEDVEVDMDSIELFAINFNDSDGESIYDESELYDEEGNAETTEYVVGVHCPVCCEELDYDLVEDPEHLREIFEEKYYKDRKERVRQELIEEGIDPDITEEDVEEELHTLSLIERKACKIGEVYTVYGSYGEQREYRKVRIDSGYFKEYEEDPSSSLISDIDTGYEWEE